MILSWYCKNVDDFGVFAATRLLTRVVWRRAYVKTSNALFRERFECPCCGWRGHRFLDYIEMGYAVKNAACPRCDSHSRHRAFFIWLNNTFQINKKTGIALIFAPERALAVTWQRAVNLHSFRVDIKSRRGVDVLADIMYLPFASDVAHLIWCHHVLEQVSDDRLALRELHRVLAKEVGRFIVSVSETTPSTTREFGRSEKALSGNRRSYGVDFSARLREAGFAVQQLNHNLSDDERRRYSVRDEPFYLCVKT
ncbi:MAG: methyltransferase domain-containing protein [Pyrinomonadaceae bacterium]